MLALDRTLVGPAALCRLDAELVERIRRGDRGLIAGSILTIVAGAGAYGIAFGIWRGAEQPLYAAIKLPILVLGVAALTLVLNAISAALLRSGLGLRESAACVLSALAIMAAILGAMAPISAFLAASAPPPDPTALGLELEDPLVAPSMRVARALLLWHVVVVACAGVLGVVRLHAIVRRLVPDPSIARRLLVAWLGAQALVGSELSWLLRPFLGKPHLAPSLFRDEALSGSFHDEVSTLLTSAMGPAGPWIGLVVLALVAFAIVLALRARPLAREVELGERALTLLRTDGLRTEIRYEEIDAVELSGSLVVLERLAAGSLDRERWEITQPDAARARALRDRIDQHRARVAAGPFRTAPSR